MRLTKAEHLFEYSAVPLNEARTLDISNLGVRALQGELGLEACPNLETLFLYGNRLSSLHVRSARQAGGKSSTNFQKPREDSEFNRDVVAHHLKIPPPPVVDFETSSQFLESKSTSDFLSHYLKHLWKLDVSGNKLLRDLGGLRRYGALGFLDLRDCDITFSMLSELHSLHIAFLDLRGNPKLREGSSDEEYRYKVTSLVPNAWVLDGKLVTFRERGMARECMQATGLGPEIESLLASVRASGAEQWHGAWDISIKAHTFLHETVPAEPLRLAEHSDRYRTAVLCQLYADQHYAESCYRVPNTRKCLPLDTSCKYLENHNLEELVNKHLSVEEQMDLISLLVVTSWRTLPKWVFQQSIHFICGIGEVYDGMSNALDWPTLCRLVLVDELVSSVQRFTCLSAADRKLLKNTKSSQLRLLTKEDFVDVLYHPLACWNARAYVLITASQGVSHGIISKVSRRQEWFQDLCKSCPDFDGLISRLSAITAKSKRATKGNSPSLLHKRERESLMTAARHCWGSTAQTHLLNPIPQTMLDTRPIALSNVRGKVHRRRWKHQPVTIKAKVGHGKFRDSSVLHKLLAGDSAGPKPAFLKPVLTEPIEALDGVNRLRNRAGMVKGEQTRNNNATEEPESVHQLLGATTTSTVLVKGPGMIQVKTAKLAQSKSAPKAITVFNLNSRRQRRHRTRLAASRKWFDVPDRPTLCMKQA